MLRHKRRTMPELDMRLVYSVRYPDDVIFADELGDETVLTYTREAPEGWTGHTGHVDADLLRGPAEARSSRSCADRTDSWRPRAVCCSISGCSRARFAPSASGPRAELMEDRLEAVRQVLRDFDMGDQWEAAVEDGIPPELASLLYELLRAYRDADVEWLLEHTDPNVEITQIAELPGARTYRGCEGFVDALLDWPRQWRGLPGRAAASVRRGR